MDDCGGGNRKIAVCQQCFDAHVALAAKLIDWGMHDVRDPSCKTCHQPIVRLSSIIKEVGRL
ncbi:hypothetical protein MHAEM_21176 [Mycolicibacterium phlei]|nr:hypothetical protein [Mycolicibacterium phlei]